MSFFSWILYWCLVISSRLLVKSQEVSTQHSLYRCNTTTNPINFLLSKINDRNVHSSVSIIFDEGLSLMNGIMLKNEKNYYFTKFLKILNTTTFQQDINYMANASEQDQHVIIIPTTSESATNLLTEIGLIEKKNPFIREIAHYIIWPTTCLTAVNCFSLEIDQMLHENLPSVSSDCYIIHCGVNSSDDGGALDQFRNSWNLYNIHAIGRDNLTRLSALLWENMHSSYIAKMNFHKATINAAIPTKDDLLQSELTYDFDNGTGTTKLISGLDFEVITYLQDSLNFSLNFTISKDWFVKRQDEWVGLAGQLLNEEADICIMKVTSLPFRRENFTFLIPHFVEGIQAFFRQPPASSFRNIFIQPFTTDLWATLTVVWLLVILSNVVAAKIKSIYQQLLEQDEQISEDSILLNIAFTCQQGWHMDPQSISMKIIFFCGSIMGLIIYVAYSAALVSTLSTTVVPIKKFSNVLENDFSITYEPTSSALLEILGNEGFGGGDEFDSHQLNLLRSKVTRINTADEGVGLVINNNAAFLGFSDVFYTSAKDKWNQTERNFCNDISCVKFSKVPFRSGMVVKRNSAIKELFNFKLLIMYEYGLMRRFQRNYVLSFHGDCDKQRQQTGQGGLGINDLFTAYVIILSGYALSVTIFLLEVVYFRWFKSPSFMKNSDNLPSGTITIFGPTQVDNYIF